MVQSLHEISTKALMQRIADELEGLIVAVAKDGMPMSTSDGHHLPGIHLSR